MSNTNCLVLVISLKRATDRRAYIINELQRTKIKEYKIVEAVDGLELTSKKLNQYTLVNKEHYASPRVHSPMEIGCALSHMRCYKLLIESKAPAALILEDDAQLSMNLPDIIQQINRFPNNWTLVQAAHERPNSPINYWSRKRIVGDCFIGINTEKSLRTVGYFISKAKANQLLNQLPVVTMPADYFFHQHIHKGLSLFNFYSLYPAPIVSSPLFVESSISDRNQKMTLPPLLRACKEIHRAFWERALGHWIKCIIPPQKPH